MFNFQEDMYEQLKEKKGAVTVFLKNGVPVRGQILATDKFTVLMMVHGKQQLIYKQAISTLANVIHTVPHHTISGKLYV
ncbi:RNA chaperone Hfq [Bacillus wiedmannii]|uniref:RNA chaperone Hfq n=1 Tax=Bacillus wiedmannii TaxID=1890302 RepID=UPI003899D872